MASDSALNSRRLWSKFEDEKLVSLVQRFGDQTGKEGNWSEISRYLPGRSNKDCRKRWFHSLDPALRKGRWSKEEDELLIAAHARLGPAWKDIALLIEGRKDDQCAKRYNDILNPSAKDRLKNWSPEEDQYLTAKVQELGHKWAAISAGLPGRPPLTCRNRWRRLSRDLLKTSDQVTQEPQSSGISVATSRSDSMSFSTGFSFPVDLNLLPDTPDMDLSADISLGLHETPLMSPAYGMPLAVDSMSIHSPPVFGMDPIGIHNTQAPNPNGPPLHLPEFSFQNIPQNHLPQEQLYESASEDPSFALQDRNYESEPNMLTDVYHPRSYSHLMHSRRYPWIPPSGNTLDNIASLDLANTQSQYMPYKAKNPGIIPEMDEESESTVEHAAVRQVFSNGSSAAAGEFLVGIGGSEGQHHHHHFHHHHYHHHYHH